MRIGTTGGKKLGLLGFCLGFFFIACLDRAESRQPTKYPGNWGTTDDWIKHVSAWVGRQDDTIRYIRWGGETHDMDDDLFVYCRLLVMSCSAQVALFQEAGSCARAVARGLTRRYNMYSTA